MQELTPEQLRQRTEQEFAELEIEESLVAPLIEADQADMRKQRYYLRLDKKTVIRTEGEAKNCADYHVPMKLVSYNSALDHILKQAAYRGKLKARRKHNKVARKQARMNRRDG